MKKIQHIGVIGAGTMGSALAQKFAQEGFRVSLADREMRFVEKGLSAIQSTLKEAVVRKIFTEKKSAEILASIHGTDNLADLHTCDLIVEAIFENFDAKREMFQSLGYIVPPETVLATNTSSFSVTELARSVPHPENFIGMHYFYHAAKNRLVEIIPGEETSPETVAFAKRFAILTGKDAIICRDRYGFAVNRFFVPWLNESVRLLEEGVADAATIDLVCMQTFKIGMGPFALMNATGVPIAYHSQKTLEAFGDFYQVAPLLEKQAGENKPWPINSASGIDIDPQAERLIRERMLGAVFLVCSQILDENICSAADLNRGARIGLQWRKGPVELMKAYGENEVKRLMEQTAEKYRTETPRSIGPNFWQMEFVSLQKNDNRAVITINRPEDLNALNETVVTQLSEKFDEVHADSEIDTIFITGSGKAFVAGADIKFFVENIKKNSLSNIEKFTRFGQYVFEKIDKTPQKVVALLNGLALGGGLELALCADIILATPNAVMAFPETGIGIYPGLGGTQRTQDRIGKGLTKYLIYTGKMLNAAAAEEIGLIDGIVSREEALDLVEGHIPLSTARKSADFSGTRWENLAKFFSENSLEEILNGDFSDCGLPAEEIEKLRKTIGRKAPVALRIAEKLINEARGCSSELEELEHIFSTKDALLGLTSIGKPVEFKGE